MLIDLRQHIITLVSVFLALAVGIVLGGSFINGASVERKVSRLLEKEFDKLRTENRQQQVSISDLTDQLRHQRDFDRLISPGLVAGKLADHGVAIIQTGTYGEATDSIRRILVQSGAEVRSVTVLNVLSEDFTSQADMSVRSITGGVGSPDSSKRALEILANSIVSGQNPKAIGVFSSNGLITSTGDYTRRTPFIVLIGGCKDKESGLSRIVDSVLIDKLKAANATTIVGAEPVDVGTSYIPTYRASGISTVDNVDEPIGQFALVYALGGEAGDFGVKKTAEGLIPQGLESGQWAKKFRR